MAAAAPPAITGWSNTSLGDDRRDRHGAYPQDIPAAGSPAMHGHDIAHLESFVMGDGRLVPPDPAPARRLNENGVRVF